MARRTKLASIRFALAAVGTSLAAAGGTTALDWVGRQGVVLYLHVLLVGFFSTGLFALLSTSPLAILNSHHLMLGVMVTGLAIASGGLFRPGMWVAAAGGVGLWIVGLSSTSLLLSRREIPDRSDANPTTLDLPAKSSDDS